MKKQYPKYRRGQLLKIKSKLPKSEREELQEYEDYCKMNAAEKKVGDMIRSVVQFRDVCGKPCTDLKTLRDFLTLLNTSNREKWTKNGIKIHIKHYLRWKFKDWSERFDGFKDVKLGNGFNGKRINEGVLINEGDIERMVKAEPRLYWKSFLAVLFESGLRPIELTSLKWKDVRFNIDGDISELHVYSTKTEKSRTVYINQSTFYLKKLQEESNSDLIFPAIRNKNKPINKATISMWLKRLSEKVLGRQIFPYVLRHSRATQLYKSMPSKVAQKFMGHGRDMTEFYAHLSSEDVKEMVAKTVYNFEDVTPERKHELEQQVEDLQAQIKFLRDRELKEMITEFYEKNVLPFANKQMQDTLELRQQRIKKGLAVTPKAMEKALK